MVIGPIIKLKKIGAFSDFENPKMHLFPHMYMNNSIKNKNI